MSHIYLMKVREDGEEKRLENENKVHRKGHETVGYSQTGHEPNMGSEN